VSSSGSTPTYDLEISESAKRELKKIAKRNKPVARVIDDAIKDLQANPRRPGVEPLTNGGDMYRYRVGDFRILFRVYDERKVVSIERVKTVRTLTAISQANLLRACPVQSA
jgi:mRNA interferase RelE/StbE